MRLISLLHQANEETPLVIDLEKSAISLNQLPEEFPHALDEVVKSKKAWLPILLTHLSKAEHIFLYSKKLPDDAYDDNLLNYKKLLERFLAQNLCPLRMIKSEFIKDVFLKRCEAEGEELAAIPSKETVEKEKVEKSNMIENLKNFYRDNKYADIVGDQYTIANNISIFIIPIKIFQIFYHITFFHYLFFHCFFRWNSRKFFAFCLTSLQKNVFNKF